MPLNNEENQSQELSQEQRNERLKILDQIKSKVTGKRDELGFDGALFELFALVGSVGDFIGREFYIDYDYAGRPSKIIQKPIRVNVLLSIFKEFNNYQKRQERMYKKNQPKTLGRRR